MWVTPCLQPDACLLPWAALGPGGAPSRVGSSWELGWAQGPALKQNPRVPDGQISQFPSPFMKPEFLTVSHGLRRPSGELWDRRVGVFEPPEVWVMLCE